MSIQSLFAISAVTIFKIEIEIAIFFYRVPTIFWYWNSRTFKDFQGPSNFIFKDQFSTEVYSM